MATANKVWISGSEKPAFIVDNAKAESAKAASECLQDNHDKYHIFFNPSGFHNHIVHHILTLYAIGASPDQIRKQYKQHTEYQRPNGEIDPTVVSALADKQTWGEYLNKEQHWHSFLEFFRQEIAKKGWQAVLSEYLFAGTPEADDLLARAYAGFLHPLIHLGFGVEFEQPAIIAEGLAQAALHADYLKPFYLETEKKAHQSNPNSVNGDSKEPSLFELIKECKMDPKVNKSADWDDGNKLRDGVLVRAPQEMINIASKWSVKPGELAAKTAEMINAVCYYTGTAQRAEKQIKYDFYFIHCVNCSIFFSSFLKQSWIDEKTKCRILEWKAWTDLAMYASRSCPEQRLEDVTNYRPKHANSDQASDDWSSIFNRVSDFQEDGHAAKLLRALANGEEVSKEQEGKHQLAITGDLWWRLGNMAIDSVEAPGNNWVRSAGFDKAWENFGPRL